MLESKNLISYVESAGIQTQKPTAKNISELTQVLRSTTKSINEVNDPQKTVENVRHMANISQNVSGKSSIWKSIAKSLLLVGCAALVCVGVLAVIPTSGASLLLTAAGMGGLIAAGAYACRDKDLSKQVSNFKSALSDKHKERDMHKETQEELDKRSGPLCSGP